MASSQCSIQNGDLFPMLKVGVPDLFDLELRRLLPGGISLEIIPMKPEQPTEVEFWITPPAPFQAVPIWPHLRGVKVVQALAAGVDGFLKVLPRDVVLCDAQGVHNIPTAEWVVAAILASLKFFPVYDEVRRAGVWSQRRQANALYHSFHPAAPQRPLPVMVEELHGQRVLIVGYGAIGRAIEERLQPFGVEIARVARSDREGVFGAERLRDLLPEADIVVLIVPFTSETAAMIGARELALLPQGCLLVNAARGPVVDTDALLEALKNGRIRAALDVTDPEPLPEGHPLWSAPNLFLTPHVAGGSPRAMVRAMEFAGAQIGRYLRGEPLLNIVSGEY